MKQIGDGHLSTDADTERVSGFLGRNVMNMSIFQVVPDFWVLLG